MKSQQLKWWRGLVWRGLWPVVASGWTVAGKTEKGCCRVVESCGGWCGEIVTGAGCCTAGGGMVEGTMAGCCMAGCCTVGGGKAAGGEEEVVTVVGSVRVLHVFHMLKPTAFQTRESHVVTFANWKKTPLCVLERGKKLVLPPIKP